MIEFNLLPDVKQQFIKAQRTKRVLVTLSTFVSLIAIGCLLLLILFVDVYQKTHLSNLDTQVQNDSSQLKSNPNLNKILTVQNQIQSLPKLEQETPQVSQIFKYLQQLTPTTATISSISADFTQNTMTVSGNADSLETVNQFVDTLEAATYSVVSTSPDVANSSGKNAFSTVDLSAFGYNKSSGAAQQAASYTITLDFDATIFTGGGQVTLTVPSQVTTRSIEDQPNPSALFVQSSTSSSSKQ